MGESGGSTHGAPRYSPPAQRATAPARARVGGRGLLARGVIADRMRARACTAVPCMASFTNRKLLISGPVGETVQSGQHFVKSL